LIKLVADEMPPKLASAVAVNSPVAHARGRLVVRYDWFVVTVALEGGGRKVDRYDGRGRDGGRSDDGNTPRHGRLDLRVLVEYERHDLARGNLLVARRWHDAILHEALLGEGGVDGSDGSDSCLTALSLLAPAPLEGPAHNGHVEHLVERGALRRALREQRVHQGGQLA
jgi:hypothetical protein